MSDKLNFLSQYRGLRKEIYVLFFGRVVTNLGAMVWPMLTMIMSQKLGMNASTIATVMVLAGIVMVPANMAGGKLADKFNKKRIIVGFDIVSIVCYIICGLVPLSYITIGLFFLAGIGQNLEGPSYNALLADLSTTADREKAYSLMYLGGNLGLVLSPTIAGLLFKNYLWLSFIISGVAIGLSTLLIAFKIKDITPEKDTSEESVYQKSRSDVSIITVLKENKVVVLFSVAISLYYAAYHQYGYLMPLDMGRVHGDTGAALYGTVSSLNCIVVVIFTPFITRIFRKIINTRKILIGQALVLVGYAVFLTFLGTIPFYYVAMLLFTWGEIFTTISEGPYTSTRIPASHRGRINGFNALLSFVLQSGSELSVGHLYDNYGSTAAWTLVICMVAAAMVLTLVLIRLDRKAYPKLYE
ncbi:MAG: MFS transporter [Firmicutes bacterium]|nr:MFS transporter [Bacillota bacterium]